jgi:hypothetical protein
VRRSPFRRAGVHRRFPRCVAVRARLELRRRRGLRRSAGRRCEEGGRAGELEAVAPSPGPFYLPPALHPPFSVPTQILERHPTPELVRPEPPARSPATLSTGASSRSRRRSLYLFPVLSLLRSASSSPRSLWPAARDGVAGDGGPGHGGGWDGGGAIFSLESAEGRRRVAGRRWGLGFFLMRGVHRTAQMLTYCVKF